MNWLRRLSTQGLVLAAYAVVSLGHGTSLAQSAKAINFDITASDLGSALNQFAEQGDQQIVFANSTVAGKAATPLHGAYDPRAALDILLRDSGLSYRVVENGVIVVSSAGDATGTAASEAPPARPTKAAPARPTPHNTANDSDAPDTGQIIVTAQRRAEFSVDVPITLTAVGADQLRTANVTVLSAVSQLSPAVRFDAEGSFVQPSIRGVGSAIGGAGVGSNVAIYVDGFYLMDPNAADFDFLNVESVQVLKGPQGTLFGRNSTGGAILVTTAEPKHQPHAVLQASYGSFNAQSYDAYVTAGLNDKIAVDVAAVYRKGNGFSHNIVTGSDKDGAYENWTSRLGVKLDPTDSLSFVARYLHINVNDPTNVNSGAFVSPQGQVFSLGAVVPGVTVASRPGEVANTKLPAFRYRTDAVQLTGQWDLSWGDIKSHTQYRKNWGHADYSLDNSSAEFLFIRVPSTDRLVTQEFIFTGGGNHLQWTAGVFYLDDRNTFPNVVGMVSGGPGQFASSTGVDTLSVAGYGDATYAVAQDFFVTAGVRFSHEELNDVFRLEGPLGGNGGLIKFPDETYNGTTPRVALRYKPNAESSLFASFARGEKAPVANTSGASFVPVKAEKLSAFEVGYKYDSHTFTFDLSGYYYDYKDLQIIVPEGLLAFILNAANSRIYGFEGQVRYALGLNFDISAGWAYTNARYRHFPNSQIYIQCLSAACGSSFGTFPPTTTDASGFVMSRAPKFTGNLSVRYTADLASGGQLTLSTGLYYTSKFYFDTSQQFPQSAYALLGLRAAWSDPSGRYTLAVRGDNVTGVRYRRGLGGFGPLGIGSVWNSPATVTGSVRVRF